jgi:hypothetical protein
MLAATAVPDAKGMTSAQILTLPRRALRHDHAIFAAAMAMQTAHLLDEALLDRVNGSTDVGGGVVALAMGAIAVAAYARLAVWARALLALVFGLAGIAGGFAVHVVHAVEDGPGGADFSGIGHAAAGVALLALGAALAVRPGTATAH